MPSPCRCGVWTTPPPGTRHTATAAGYFTYGDVSFFSLSAVLFGLCPDLRVVYTPPLYWMPHVAPHPGSAPLGAPPSSLTGPPKSKSSVLATGHCIEANLTSDVALVCGSQQVSIMIQE